MRFFTSESREPVPRRDQIDVQILPAVQRGDKGLLRPLVVKVQHAYVEPVDALLKVGDLDRRADATRVRDAATRLLVPAVDQQQNLPVTVEAAGQPILQQAVKMTPVRHWELHFLPHSHVDIGYTHVQTEVEQKQWDYLRQAIEIARNTADYPSRSTIQMELAKCCGPWTVICSRRPARKRRSSCRRCVAE